MNSKKAKKLRKLLGYHPSQPRVYDYGRERTIRSGESVSGLTNTIKLDKCKRGDYQRAKRSGVGEYLLGGA